MKPKPLNDKLIYMPVCCGKALRQSDVKGFEYEEVKAAVEWYKKYRNYLNKFFDDYPELTSEFYHKVKTINTNENYFMVNIFNDWLFDKAFEDVI